MYAGERLATPTSRKAEIGQVPDPVKTKRQTFQILTSSKGYPTQTELLW